MTTPFLPSFLYGEDSFEVEGRLKPVLRRVVKSRKAPLDVLLPIASPNSSRSSVPVVMIPRGFHPGFHIPSLLPELFDLFASDAADLLDDDAFDAFVVHQTGVYGQILSQPWGVLCALARDAQIWLFDDAPWKGQLDRGRLLPLLQATEREAGWLRSLNGRYDSGGEKPGDLWQADTVVTWLTARAGLPPITSQAAWDEAVQQLMQVEWT